MSLGTPNPGEPREDEGAAAGPPEPAADRRRARLSALLLAGFGGAVAWAASRYPIGTLRQMGPGFFPLALGLLLVLLGGLVLLEPAARESEEPVEPFDGRAFACVAGAIAAFLLLGRTVGLLPAAFALVLLGALADRRNRPRTALALAAAATAFAVLLFAVLLGLPFPLLEPAF